MNFARCIQCVGWQVVLIVQLSCGTDGNVENEGFCYMNNLPKLTAANSVGSTGEISPLCVMSVAELGMNVRGGYYSIDTDWWVLRIGP